MLGDSAVLGTGGGGGSSGDAVAAATSAAAAAAGAEGGAHDGGGDTVTGRGGGGGGGGGDGGVGSNSGDDAGDRSFGGNRWPRQETLALLKIRLDMDMAFRDASVKGPLWEEVSRKLAELGYHRNAKKCKEKFENVYKYHKRTKEGRSGKSDGKTYRFFDQLEALENNPSNIHHQSQTTPSSIPPPPQHNSAVPLPATPVSIVVTTSTVPLPTPSTVPMPPPLPVANTTPNVTVPSTTPTATTLPLVMPQGINLTIPSYPPQTNPMYFPPSSTTSTPNPTPSFLGSPAELLSNSSSSSTSSDETLEGRRKRKRKWKDFFERLMKDVIEKQEELQKRFLEAIEKREQERVAREEAWRMQEMQRINREREILSQERSIAAAKDAAVMAFLQKVAEQQNLGQALNNITIPQPQPQPPPQPTAVTSASLQQLATVPQPVMPVAPQQQQQQPQPQQQQQQQQQVTNMEIVKAGNNNNNNNGENLTATGSSASSRWPKAEVQALINLRTSLDAKYQESGPKGPLWEEISGLMRKMGYNRNAKRCKEKWENINKYFKKVKESNKKRPEDSKTCPYFHQLDALYRERNKLDNNQLKLPESMTAPLMVLPEQQWPPQDPQQKAGPEVTMKEIENDEDEEDEDKDGDEIEEDDEEEDEGGGNNYEIVVSKPAASSVGASAE